MTSANSEPQGRQGYAEKAHFSQRVVGQCRHGERLRSCGHGESSRLITRSSKFVLLHKYASSNFDHWYLHFSNMVSFEDYDEFGNYIGADLGSEDEEDEMMETGFGQAPATSKVERTYIGPQTSEIAESMKACDADALMVQITKLYHTTDAQSFRAFGRVLSGTLRKDVQVKVFA